MRNFLGLRLGGGYLPGPEPQHGPRGSRVGGTLSRWIGTSLGVGELFAHLVVAGKGELASGTQGNGLAWKRQCLGPVWVIR